MDKGLNGNNQPVPSNNLTFTTSSEFIKLLALRSRVLAILPIHVGNSVAENGCSRDQSLNPLLVSTYKTEDHRSQPGVGAGNCFHRPTEQPVLLKMLCFNHTKDRRSARWVTSLKNSGSETKRCCKRLFSQKSFPLHHLSLLRLQLWHILKLIQGLRIQ